MTQMRRISICVICVICGWLHSAFAEVVRVEIRRQDDAGTHERLIGRVYFKIDPKIPANQGIADIALAPTAKTGWWNSRAISSSSNPRNRSKRAEPFSWKS